MEYLYTMLTNDPFSFILVFICIGLLFQIILSGIVRKKRRQTLMEDYGFTDKQIEDFYWKSIAFFPVTWVLLVSQGIKTLWQRLRR